MYLVNYLEIALFKPNQSQIDSFRTVDQATQQRVQPLEGQIERFCLQVATRDLASV